MIIIEGKRWFQKTYGNTYHSVKVYDNDKLIDKIDFTYGYGDMYIQSAFELLTKHGYFKLRDEQDMYNYKDRIRPLYSEFWDSVRANDRHNYHITVSDVERKKDLI